ncbi:hypothetical protein M569_03145, partial [Genlisea aurea]
GLFISRTQGGFRLGNKEGYEDEDEKEDKGEISLQRVLMPETKSLHSESCSFTSVSNDDDSSSTTTEPTFSLSPDGRSKRVIVGWQKGDLLGRGSFGSVFEGISDDGFFFAVKEVSLLDHGQEGKLRILQLEQ